MYFKLWNYYYWPQKNQIANVVLNFNVQIFYLQLLVPNKNV